MLKFRDMRLLTPGPTNVPQRVLAAGAVPMMHHRSPEFSSVLEGTIEKMRLLFGTAGDVLLIHTTGRGGMEAAITNLFSPGDEMLSVCNGKFGEMFADIGTRYCLKAFRVAEDWLKPLHLEEIEGILEANPGVRAITAVQSDTSTAVENDIEAIGKIARKYGKLLLVDAISSLGGAPFKFDEWGVDVAITASQKGLMSPTGLAFAAVSGRAWEAVREARLPRFYCNFQDIKAKLSGKRPETPGSTPVSLVCSVNEALNMIMEEGMENVYKRHHLLARSIRAGIEAMGLKLFPAEVARRSSTVTAIEAPPGMEVASLRQKLREEYGLFYAGGLGPYSNRTFRIGHMGNFYNRDALMAVMALEGALYCEGTLNSIGAGVTACLEAIRQEERQ